MDDLLLFLAGVGVGALFAYNELQNRKIKIAWLRGELDIEQRRSKEARDENLRLRAEQEADFLSKTQALLIAYIQARAEANSPKLHAPTEFSGDVSKRFCQD